jgi:hypothetical protein
MSSVWCRYWNSPDTHFVWRVCCMLRMVWEKIVLNYCPGMERLRRTMKIAGCPGQDLVEWFITYLIILFHLCKSYYIVWDKLMLWICKDLNGGSCELFHGVILSFVGSEWRNLRWTSIVIAGNTTEFGSRNLLNTDLKYCCCSSLPILIFEPGTIPVEHSVS